MKRKEKMYRQKWKSNQRPHSQIRTIATKTYIRKSSGADHSAILTIQNLSRDCENILKATVNYLKLEINYV